MAAGGTFLAANKNNLGKYILILSIIPAIIGSFIKIGESGAIGYLYICLVYLVLTMGNIKAICILIRGITLILFQKTSTDNNKDKKKK